MYCLKTLNVWKYLPPVFLQVLLCNFTILKKTKKAEHPSLFRLFQSNYQTKVCVCVCMFQQVQAAIKKKMKKKKSIDQGDGQSAAHAPQKSRPPALRAVTAAVEEDSEALEEKLEEMMEGRQRRNVEAELEEEPVDLLPIVDSVFGQVGFGSSEHIPVRVSVCMSCVSLGRILGLIECLAGELDGNPAPPVRI